MVGASPITVLGLLYDVHGNLPALEAVLDDARELPVDRWLVGGDVALFGAWPGETVARLGELAGARWIRGNTERWLVDRSDAPPFVDAVVADVLHELDVDALSTLPSEATEGGTCFVHASPVSDMRSFAPAEPADDEDELLAGETHARLVAPPAPTANWSRVVDGRIVRIRVAFDPRALAPPGA